MVKKLAEMQLVQHTPYQGVVLTLLGERVALEIIRHHRLLELYLTENLGYDWDQVDAEAERLEHVISEEFEDRIDEALGYPTSDPHGAPIPTKEGAIKQRDYQLLSNVKVGQTACIQEVNDRSPEMLRYMASLGLKPEVRLVVKERAPFNGPLLIQVVGAEEQALGLEVADHIYVTLLEEARGAN
jgi:DtxR family Mn-dependent transcriptional regulator